MKKKMMMMNTHFHDHPVFLPVLIWRHHQDPRYVVFSNVGENLTFFHVSITSLKTNSRTQVREWALNRLEGADKVAVQCSEKYFRHALNVVRRRISKHVRDFRDRSEEVGRVLYVVVTHSHNTNESRDQGQELTHTHTFIPVHTRTDGGCIIYLHIIHRLFT